MHDTQNGIVCSLGGCKDHLSLGKVANWFVIGSDIGLSPIRRLL